MFPALCAWCYVTGTESPTYRCLLLSILPTYQLHVVSHLAVSSSSYIVPSLREGSCDVREHSSRPSPQLRLGSLRFLEPCLIECTVPNNTPR